MHRQLRHTAQRFTHVRLRLTPVQDVGANDCCSMCGAQLTMTPSVINARARTSAAPGLFPSTTICSRQVTTGDEDLRMCTVGCVQQKVVEAMRPPCLRLGAELAHGQEIGR